MRVITPPSRGRTAAATRREFLKAAAAFGALAAAPGCAAFGPSRFARDPFSLGVASGYPSPTGVVLWTRLAPEPLAPGGGMGTEVAAVGWEVAEDDRMLRVVRSGTDHASPGWAHSVHVEVDGLAPDRWYWYRFRSGDAESPIGRTRTAPAAGSEPARLRFAVASCQHYEHGYYGAYRHMLGDELDLIVHVGDYIYESSSGGPVRRHGAGEPFTLDDYRVRHALYKTDRDLQAAHGAAPWLLTWDDHEVDNDYANARSEDLDAPELFLSRRAAAYQAYYEHMPLPRRAVPTGPNAQLYARLDFGRLARFHLLDDRQYRDPQPCPPPGRGGSNLVGRECSERSDPRRTLLGREQEDWLRTGLSSDAAQWNVIAQETRIAPLDFEVGPGESHWTDGWDGYPAARERLLDALAAGPARNPVLFGGDVHSFWVTDLHRGPGGRRAPVVAPEFVGTSITSQGPGQERLDSMIGENPHVRFANGAYRGYLRVEISADRTIVDLRAMETVIRPDAACQTLASFVVEDGVHSAVKA